MRTFLRLNDSSPLREESRVQSQTHSECDHLGGGKSHHPLPSVLCRSDLGELEWSLMGSNRVCLNPLRERHETFPLKDLSQMGVDHSPSVTHTGFWRGYGDPLETFPQKFPDPPVLPHVFRTFPGRIPRVLGIVQLLTHERQEFNLFPCMGNSVRGENCINVTGVPVIELHVRVSLGIQGLEE